MWVCGCVGGVSITLGVADVEGLGCGGDCGVGIDPRGT